MEDNAADVLLLTEAMRMNGIGADVHVLSDGERAIAFLDALEAAPGARSPMLVLLDLNLPRRSGHDVLRHYQQSSRGKDIAIVIVSSSDAPADRDDTMRSGATDYLRKPAHFDGFLQLGNRIRQVLDAERARRRGDR